jgi:glutamate/aspartate transport system permease protein
MNWGIFLETVPDGDLAWWQMLASGLGWTLACAALAWIIALTLGTALGIARTWPHVGVRRAGSVPVELLRNMPLVVQFFLWYFVLPELVPPLKHWVVESDPVLVQFIAAVLCLGCFTAARIAEQVRSGVASLGPGPRNAARALGLSEWGCYRHVLLPVSFRIILPPLTSELMNLVKNTAVAWSIGLTELFFRTREMGEITFNYVEAFAAATVLYLSIAFTANRFMALIERRLAVPGVAGTARSVQ